MHEPLHIEPLETLDERDRAAHGVVPQRGQLGRGLWMTVARRRVVHDGGRSGPEQPAQRVGIAQVDAVHRDVRRDVGEPVRIGPRANDCMDVGAELDEPVHEGRSDEPCRTGDEDVLQRRGHTCDATGPRLPNRGM